MLLSEFIDRTGYQPTADEYQIIEQEYYLFDGNKDAFCQAWVKAHPAKAGQIWRAQKEAQRIDRITRKCESVILKRIKKAKNIWQNLYKFEEDRLYIEDAEAILSFCFNFLESKRIMDKIENIGSPMFCYWAKRVNDNLCKVYENRKL